MFEGINTNEYQEYRDNTKALLKKHQQAIHEHSPRCLEAQDKAQSSESSLKAFLESSSKIRTASPTQRVLYVGVLLMIPCVYCINLLLISDATEHLAQRRFDENVGIFALLIPLLLLTFEIIIAALNHYVQQNPAQQNQYSPILQRLVHVVVWITPTLFFATKIAEYSSEGRLPYLDEAVLIIALTALAWISDAFIVYGIEYIIQAVTLLSYSYRKKKLQKTSAQYSKQARKELQIVGDRYESYKEVLQNYDSTYPDRPLELLPFNHTARQVIAMYLCCEPAEVV
ncbi:MAG: hypothetical protein AAFQ14_07280 [Cyanobacteria bacterium J06621_12]